MGAIDPNTGLPIPDNTANDGSSGSGETIGPAFDPQTGGAPWNPYTGNYAPLTAAQMSGKVSGTGYNPSNYGQPGYPGYDPNNPVSWGNVNTNTPQYTVPVNPQQSVPNVFNSPIQGINSTPQQSATAQAVANNQASAGMPPNPGHAISPVGMPPPAAGEGGFGPVGAPAPIPQQNIFQGGAVEQNALGGNRQQVSNFMNALNQVGAGSNNGFMNSPSHLAQPQITNLVDPTLAGTNSGGSQANSQYGGGYSDTNQSNTAPGGYQVDPNVMYNYANGLDNNLAGTGQGTTYSNDPNASTTYSNDPNASSDPPKIVTPDTQPGQQHTTTHIIPAQQSATAQDPRYLGSDEQLKTAIKPGDKDLNAFLNSINAHSYKYKNPELDGIGTFTSPMAQELEKTELGKQAVIETPRGKMVNYPRLGAVNLAAVSVVHKETVRLQEQINQLRKSFKLGK